MVVPPEPSGPIEDVRTYVIRYRGHRVGFSAVNVPHRLKPLLRMLNRLVARR